MTVNFTPRKLVSFKAALAAAEAKQEQHFKFEGDTYLTSYAKYLAEYLESRLESA